MNRLKAIRASLSAFGLDAILLDNEKDQYYASGFPFTDGAVIIGLEDAALITDSRYIEAARAQAEGMRVLLYDRSSPLDMQLQQFIRDNRIQRLGFEEHSMSYGRYLELNTFAGCELIPAQSILRQLRASKSPEELEYMKRAQLISEQALEDILPLIRPGMTEKELAAQLVFRMLYHGSEGNSFSPVVVSGSKTSLPHGVPGDKSIHEGDFITMDFGSTYKGYCSDMTRTVAVGYATEEMKDIYAIVLEAQLAGIAAARAGIPGREIDAAARAVIEGRGYGKYFGHGFGHSLGLDIHENPNANPGGSVLMPEGAVVSAEPGIYLPGRFGVRIEDVLILSRDGCENITHAPKELLILG